MPFSMLMAARPVSLNNLPNSKYRSAIQEVARKEQGESPLLIGNLYARITWFHRRRRGQDVDNIIKGIFDALKTIVFEDDILISRCLVQSIDTSKDYALGASSFDANKYAILLAWLGDETKDHILCVEIGTLAGQTVGFGPVG